MWSPGQQAGRTGKQGAADQGSSGPSLGGWPRVAKSGLWCVFWVPVRSGLLERMLHLFVGRTFVIIREGGCCCFRREEIL